MEELHKKWEKTVIEFIKKGYPSRHEFKRLCRQIVEDFDSLPLKDVKKPRVGVVGEILVKFLPAANNYLVDLLEQEGAEAVVPDLTDFLLYCFYNTNFKAEHLGMKKSTARMGNLGIKALEWFRKPAVDALKASKRFDPPSHIEHLASGSNGQRVCFSRKSDRRGLVPYRRNAGADPQRCTKHCLHTAFRLSAKPRSRERCY